MSFRPPHPRRIPVDAHDFIIWSMDESSTPVPNTGVGPAQSLTGAGIFGATGIFKTSVDFRSTSLATGDSTVEPDPTSFTYSVWVWTRTYSTGSPHIVNKSWHTIGEGWGSPYGIGITLHGSNDGAWDVGGSTGGVSVPATDPIPLSAWTHLVFTWDGFWVRAYKNGVLAGSNHVNMTGTPQAFDFGHHGPWNVGGNSLISGDFFDGYIDDVRISNVARSAEYVDLQYRWGIGDFDDPSLDPTTFFADFSFLPIGKMANADFLSATALTFARASVATVQTSETTLDSTPSTDQARIGSIGAAWGRGLVIEETRTNTNTRSRSMTGAATSGSPTITEGFSHGPDGVTGGSRVQLGSGGYVDTGGTYAAGLNLFSAWVRATSGTTSIQLVAGMLPANDYAVGDEAADIMWRRLHVLGTSTAGTGNAIAPDTRDKTANGGVVAAATDSIWDFKQVEAGTFLTEAIITAGSAETRAGEQLTIASAGTCVDTGSLNVYFKLIPKGDSDGYSANLRLWSIDSNNFAEIDSTTLILRVSVAATIWETQLALAWQARDVLEIFVAAGGGTPGVGVYRVNGGVPIQLGSSDTNLGTVPNTGPLDLLCNGTSNQFSSWVKFLSFWKAGLRPFWAVTPPAFLPTTLSGLQQWLVASAGVGLSGGTVATWDDQSGNLNAVAQANGSLQPTFVASGINAKPDMTYAGGQTLYGADGLDIQHAITAFAIVASTLSGVNQAVFGKGFTQSAWQLTLGATGRGSFSTAGAGSGPSDFPLNDGQPHTLVGVFDNISQIVRLWVDGILQFQSQTTAFDILTVAYPISIGSATDDGAALNFPLTGDVPEVGLYNRALGSTELGQLNAYLTAKAGIPIQFRPDALAHLELWFRIDFGPTIDMTNHITDWSDLSGNSRDLAQSNSGNQPLVDKDLNGNILGAALDGGSSFMYWSNTDVATTAIAVFGIFSSTQMIDQGQLWGKGFSSTQWLFAGHTPGMSGGTIDFRVGGVSTARGDVFLDDGRPHTLLGLWDDSTQVISLYVDGYLQYQAGTFSGPISGGDDIGIGAEIGNPPTSNSAFFLGDLIEAGVYSTTLSQAQVQKMNDYLAKRAPNPSRNPKELPGLNSWFRSTLSVTQSGTVSSWGDLSGAGILPTLTQPTGGLRPTFTTSGINGLPQVDGTGTEALTGATTLFGTTALSLFLVFQTTGSGTYGIWGKGPSAVVYKLGMSSGNLHAYMNSGGANSASDAAVNDGAPHTVVVTWDNSDGGEIRLYLDGLLQSTLSVESGTLSPTSDPNALLAMASDPSTFSDQFVGSVAEVGSYNRRLSPKEAIALSHYLSYRAGIDIIEFPTDIPSSNLAVRPDLLVEYGGNQINSVTRILPLAFNNIFSLLQGDIAQRPVVVDPSLNSFPILSFDGTTSLYSSNTDIATSDPTQLTMYVVFRTSDVSSLAIMAGMHGANPHYSFDLVSGSLQANINGQFTASDVAVNDGNVYWAVMAWDGSSGTIDLYINGVPQSITVGTTAGPITDGSGDGDQHSLGAGVTSAGATIANNFTGDLSEHGSFSTKLAGADLANLFSYLRTRSGR